MGKLHELLAVEGARRGAFDKILAETTQVFGNRQDLFMGALRTYEPYANEDAAEKGVVERHAMTSTVKQRLEYLGQYFVDYVDTVYQKEMTNQEARGSIVFEGRVLAENLPVTFLLNIESTLARVRETLNATPTHQAGVSWVPDPEYVIQPVVKGEHPEIQTKTKKIIVPFELSPATKEHKAQVEKLTEDKPIGKFYRQLWSGMITPAEKSEILLRMDKMIEAVRTARQRANDQEAVTDKIGSKIINVLLGKKD